MNNTKYYREYERDKDADIEIGDVVEFLIGQYKDMSALGVVKEPLNEKTHKVEPLIPWMTTHYLSLDDCNKVTSYEELDVFEDVDIWVTRSAVKVGPGTQSRTFSQADEVYLNGHAFHDQKGTIHIKDTNVSINDYGDVSYVVIEQ